MEKHLNISASIAKHWIWQNAEYLKWWLDLLLLASCSEEKQLVGRHLVTLQAGQLIASLSFLCNRWNCSRSRAKNLIDLLRQEGMITKEVHGNISIITILQHDQYVATDNTPSCTPCDTPCAHLENVVTDCETGNCTGDNAHPCAHLEHHLAAQVDDYLDKHVAERMDAYMKEHADEIIKSYISEHYNNVSEETEQDNAENNSLQTNITGSKDRNERNERKEKRSKKVKKENKEKKEKKESLALFSDENSVSDLTSDAPFLSDTKEIFSYWNLRISEAHSAMNPIRSLGGKRRGSVAARCREYGLTEVKAMVDKAVASDFLNGKNNKGWMATFDWVMMPSNFQKVLEGNYDNGRQQQQNKNGYGNEYTEQRRYERLMRCGMEVTATCPEDYEGEF